MKTKMQKTIIISLLLVTACKVSLRQGSQDDGANDLIDRLEQDLHRTEIIQGINQPRQAMNLSIEKDRVFVQIQNKKYNVVAYKSDLKANRSIDLCATKKCELSRDGTRDALLSSIDGKTVFQNEKQKTFTIDPIESLRINNFLQEIESSFVSEEESQNI
jgi:hypothetical protein